MNYTYLILVGIGGMIGSIGRYLAGKVVQTRTDSIFPYSTLSVNLLGSFILGLILSIATRRNLSPEWGLFLGTGVCGGFTTFSAFSLENLNLLQQKPALSILYISISLAGGVLFAALGVWAGRTF